VYLDISDVVTVNWDDATATVLVEWRGWAESADFKAVLDAELQALREHHGTRLLADCRRQRIIDEADQDRADREWLPEALAAGLKRFAIVLPDNRLAAINLEDRLNKVPISSLEVGYFASTDAAREWLAT
jgi:hypothetical protein